MARQKNHRSGGKFTASHTTVIDASCIVTDTADRIGEVSKIVLGPINMERTGSAKGQRRIKLTDGVGCIQVTVRDNMAIQALLIFTSNIHTTKLALSRAIRNNGIHLSFGKKADA